MEIHKMAPFATRRSVAVLLLILLILTSCGSGSTAQNPTNTLEQASNVEETTPSSTVVTTSTPESVEAEDVLVLPAIPAVLIPPLTELTSAGTLIADALAEATLHTPLPFRALSVFGAECGNDGRITLEPSDRDGPFNAGNGFVGSFTDQGITVVAEADGSGSYTKAGLQIIVGADGSGSFVNGIANIAVEPDGSGLYVGGDTSIEVNADGSGTYASPDGNIVVGANGSGTFTSESEVIVNSGDGTGTYSGPLGDIAILGDGTGMSAGEEILVAPLPPVPPIDIWPAFEHLAPNGPLCATVVRFSSTLLFDAEGAELRPEAAPMLAELARLLAETESTIEVNGHTDSVGSISNNLDLSQRRAEAVVSELQALGVGAEMIPTGVGSGQSIAANQLPDGSDNPGGQRANGRVEIIVSQ